MEELVVEVNVNMSVELQSLTLLEVPTGYTESKPLEIELVPHLTVQLMKLSLLVHWYEATSVEHT